MTEEWRDVAGYEGLYQISNLGNIKALSYNHTGVPKLMRPGANKRGYLQICLTKNNKKKTKRIHRLVAEAFIPNPQSLASVNHIDENKRNNSVQNLEWCTISYNSKYGTSAERRGRPIKQIDKNGKVVAVFPTSKEAERKTGGYHSHILKCCYGERKTCIGYTWKFADGERNHAKRRIFADQIERMGNI